MFSSRWVFGVWCSATIFAAFVLADDKHPRWKHNHHHEHHGHHENHEHHESHGDHDIHYHHHSRTRYHGGHDHHHRHHHHGHSKTNATTTTTSTTTSTSSPVQENSTDIGFASNTTSVPLDLGIVSHQPDNGGIDLRAFKAVEQQPNDVISPTTTKSYDELISEALGEDQIRTTTTFPTTRTINEIITEHISESTNAPAVGNDRETLIY